MPSVERQGLITMIALLLAALYLVQPALHAVAQQEGLRVSLAFSVNAPLPPGFVPLAVALDGDRGVAVAGVAADGAPTLLYYSMEGALQWSLQLDGIEPVTVVSSDGYIHVVTRLRTGALEGVRYYRVTPGGEIVQEYTAEVARAALIYYAVRVPLGFVLVGVKHGGGSGWDPMMALLVPGTGVSWVYEASYPGDQRPVKPVVTGDGSLCALYRTPDSKDALLVCVDSATGGEVESARLTLEGLKGSPLLLPGPCVAYSTGESIKLVAPDGVGGELAVGGAPETLTAAAAAQPSGGPEVLVLLGVSGSRPWAALAPSGPGGCPSGRAVAGPIGSQGLVPVDADSSGPVVAVALLAKDGPSILALGSVSVSEETGSTGDGSGGQPQQSGGSVAGTVRTAPGEQPGEAGGIAGFLESPALTAALLASLLAMLAAVAALKRRRPAPS